LATAIERFLYGDPGVQGMTEFAVSPGVVRLHLTPWEGPRTITIAIFNEARLTSLEAYPVNLDDLDPPWDVIGFDCCELGGGRWRFVLHCSSIEWRGGRLPGCGLRTM